MSDIREVSPDAVEGILARAAAAGRSPVPELLPVIYRELRGMAAAYLKRERPGHTLQPTALVHEAYLRLAGDARPWRDRTHFLAAAATAMRRVLVDHARAKRTEKRGGGRAPVPFDAILDVAGRVGRVLELDELLAHLADLDPRKAQVVEMRVFGGMTYEEIAAALDVARSTVAEDWVVARAWLAAQFGRAGQP